jgi:DNA-binding CsgD family transcriptional regulator
MNAFSSPTAHSQQAFARAFGLGWAAADEAHLPALPEALALVLSVPAARMAVTRRDGTALMEYAYPGGEQPVHNPALLYERKEPLGDRYTLRVTLQSSAELSPEQADTLDAALQLIRSSIDCILIGQRDRAALGAPFARLQEREWQICLALERPNGEKQIADSFSWSRHTLHSYIKGLYRKLNVQSRLQLLEMLKRARENLRRRTLEGFTAAPGKRSQVPVAVRSPATAREDGCKRVPLPLESEY